MPTPPGPTRVQASDSRGLIPVNQPLLIGRELEYVRNCVESGWISSAGKYIDRFEAGWAAYCNRRHGVSVSNGTAALQLAVSALDLPPRGEVILPSFTIVSCLEAVLRNGLRPVLVDCDPWTYCMDIDEVKRTITAETVAIMAVHIYGHPVNMGRLLALAEEHGLRVIEDAAEAHGAECFLEEEWQRCGSFGDVSTFSFYANKNICCGEGGMVLTNDDDIATRLRQRRNLCFGEKERFRHEDRGWNFRMTNLQAAIGCAQLEQIDSFVERKRSVAALYNEGLAGLPLRLPHVEQWARSSVWMYGIVVGKTVPFDASEVASRMQSHDIQTRPFFRGMHEQPVYRRMGLFHNGAFPNTEWISRRGLYLPSGQAITDSQISYVISAVHAVLT